MDHQLGDSDDSDISGESNDEVENDIEDENNNDDNDDEDNEDDENESDNDDDDGDNGDIDEDNNSAQNGSEDNEGEGDDESKTSNNSGDSVNPGIAKVGGSIEKPAFALLDGFLETGESRERVTVPLTRLPAVLGRTHSNSSDNFFGLGGLKTLSRRHCVIDFRDDRGGKMVVKEGTRDQVIYEKHDNTQEIPEMIRCNDQDVSPLGFFAIEVLGKNAILVGGKRIDQGQVAILQSGIPIRINAYQMYFLLPNLPNPRRTILISTTKKRKIEKPPSPPVVQPPVKKTKAAPFSGLQAELDALDVDTLLGRMTEAVQAEAWERKHQLIGSTIAVHAVKAASAAHDIQEMFVKDGGVSRSDIMTWIRDSSKYSRWVKQMLSKMEAKSYQNTITKALLKLGHVRTGSGGRYIKWILSGMTESKKKEVLARIAARESAAASGNENNSDNEQGNENDDDDDDDDDDNDNGDDNNDGNERDDDDDDEDNDDENDEDDDNSEDDSDSDNENEGQRPEQSDESGSSGDESGEELIN